MDLVTQQQRAEELRRLHHGPEVLVFANVWDVASARVFEELGYPALATSSAGVAAVFGYPDGQRIQRQEMADMVRRIAHAVSVPVSADMEAGYGTDEESAAQTVLATIEAGAVGLNIEDGTKDKTNPLIDFDLQVRRLKAVRRAAESANVPVVLNARTDAYWMGLGHEGERFTETVRRGNAYLAAGADCIFVPGAQDPVTIEKLCREIAGPVNILGGPGVPAVSELKRLGVTRLSVGSGPARAALAYARKAAEELKSTGTYSGLTDLTISHTEVNRLLEKR